MASSRLIENSFSEVKHTDFFDKLALVAHNCYQVKEKDHENNIGFITRLVQSGHLAMMEHYRFAFVLNEEQYHRFLELHNPFYELGEFMRDKKTRDPSQEQLLDTKFRTSDGESAEETMRRMNIFFDRILKEYEGKKIAVVSHRWVNKILFIKLV